MDDKILVGYKIFLLIFLLNSKYSFFISVIFMNILITGFRGFQSCYVFKGAPCPLWT